MLQDTQSSMDLQANNYQLEVNTKPFHLSLKRRNHEAIWGMISLQAHWRGTWVTLRQAELKEHQDQRWSLQFTSQDDLALSVTLYVEIEKASILVSASTSTPEVTWLGVKFEAKPDERFLGLGERFDQLDQRGNEIELFVKNGAVRDLTYKPIPFFMSTAGYGVQIQTDVRCLVRLAMVDDPNTVVIRNATNALNFRLMPGDSLKDILSQYTGQVGHPAVPPKWVFGPWKSRDWHQETEATVLEDVNLGRKHELAGTVKLIDALWEPETHTFTFDPTKYPDPEGMIRHLRDQGYRLVLWISPFMVQGQQPSEAFQLCAKRGYLIKDKDGQTYIHRLGNSPTYIGSCIDFTNPNAVAWWKDNIRRLIKMGIDGFKTDFGEQVPEDAHFYDGRTGKEVHNIFPRLYNEATYQILQEETDGVLLARSAWDGSQRLSAIWAGDQTADFAPASGLPSVIIAGQTAGLSGFPFWASDIGGYFGTPTDEVFVRWAQFGAFSPIMQVHGTGKREPWAFSAETLDIYRKYAQLHLELFPYIYSYAHEASRTGLPIMRALALEYPNDPNVWADMAEHQYFFGQALLVAPVYYGLSRYRHVYLPHGRWCDFWTGTPVDGGQTVTASAQPHEIPVFAKAGALIPFLDGSPKTLLPTTDPTIPTASNDLRVRIYPGADGSFTLYDGTHFAWDDHHNVLQVSNAAQERTLVIELVTKVRGDFIPSSSNTHPFHVSPEEIRGGIQAKGYRLRLEPHARGQFIWKS